MECGDALLVRQRSVFDLDQGKAALGSCHGHKPGDLFRIRLEAEDGNRGSNGFDQRMEIAASANIDETDRLIVQKAPDRRRERVVANCWCAADIDLLS
jgi:hypothetical protein